MDAGMRASGSMQRLSLAHWPTCSAVACCWRRCILAWQWCVPPACLCRACEWRNVTRGLGMRRSTRWRSWRTLSPCPQTAAVHRCSRGSPKTALPPSLQLCSMRRAFPLPRQTRLCAAFVDASARCSSTSAPARGSHRACRVPPRRYPRQPTSLARMPSPNRARRREQTERPLTSGWCPPAEPSQTEPPWPGARIPAPSSLTACAVAASVAMV